MKIEAKSAGYTFPLKDAKMNLRLYGTIENLFDHEYFENGFRTLGRQALLEPVEWTADGWLRAKGGTLDKPLPKGPAKLTLPLLLTV